MTGFFDRPILRNEDPNTLSQVWRTLQARLFSSFADMERMNTPAVPAEEFKDWLPNPEEELAPRGLDFERGCLGFSSSMGDAVSGQLDIDRWKNETRSRWDPRGFPLLPPAQSSSKVTRGDENAVPDTGTPGEEQRSDEYSHQAILPESVLSESDDIIFRRPKELCLTIIRESAPVIPS